MMRVLQRYSRTFPYALFRCMISSYSGIPSMYPAYIRDMVFACGFPDSGSLLQSPFSISPIDKASLLNPPAILSIGWSIYLKSTIWYIQVLALLFLFFLPSPPFSFSLPISPSIHLLHLFSHVFIISPLIYVLLWFCSVFFLAFPSWFVLAISLLFSSFADIKMYHRALFISKFA